MNSKLPFAWLVVAVASASAFQVNAPVFGATYEEEILADEPFVFYRFNEADGANALDSSGNDRHGEYTGGVDVGQASLTKGLGTSAQFDGVSGLVQLAALDFESDQLTIETWLNLDKLSDGCCTSIFSPNGWSQGWVHYNLKGDANIEFALNGGGPNNHNTEPEAVPFAEWVHIASVYDKEEASVKTYINGQAIEVSPPDFSTPQTVQLTEAAQIGAWQDTRFLGGLMDEFAIYESALSAERIETHFLSAASADLNGDEQIDFADYEILLANYNQPGTPDDGDLNFSGAVDFADFVRFRTLFEAETPNAAAVPEPGMELLLFQVLGLMVLLTSRVRRRA